ncbi:MAG: SPOR domain-containing protein [Acidobacteriota bacterium]
MPVSLAGLASESRLCDQCRTIVQEAFPGPGSRVSASAAAVQNNGVMALVHQGAPVLDRTQADSPAFDEDGSSVVESLEKESQFPMWFERPDESKSDLREDKHSDDGEHTAEAELDDMPAQARAGTSNSSVEAKPEDTDDTRAGEFQPPEQPGALTEPVSEGASLFDNQTEEPLPSEQEAVNDPWDHPLPAWNNSQNEWPVVVESARRKPFGTLRASLAALVLLAGAAGFYLLILQPVILQPASSEQRTSVPADYAKAERVPAAAEPDVSAAKSAESEPQQVASSPSAETSASTDSKPIEALEVGTANGKFSLQAAAFPTQAAADELAEKLRRAGVPSYIVSADLGRRRRWFRVRIGRFNAVEDAQRFAAEAKVRAKAAGMSLELIACQYDQP